MKYKGRRQSKNVEVQTPKQKRNAEHGLNLQSKAYANTDLREPTKVSKWKQSEDMAIVRELTNPGAMQSRMANGGHAQVSKNPAERRGQKDPKPGKFVKNGKDLPFFKHKTKGK